MISICWIASGSAEGIEHAFEPRRTQAGVVRWESLCGDEGRDTIRIGRKDACRRCWQILTATEESGTGVDSTSSPPASSSQDGDS